MPSCIQVNIRRSVFLDREAACGGLAESALIVFVPICGAISRSSLGICISNDHLIQDFMFTGVEELPQCNAM